MRKNCFVLLNLIFIYLQQDCYKYYFEGKHTTLAPRGRLIGLLRSCFHIFDISLLDLRCGTFWTWSKGWHGWLWYTNGLLFPFSYSTWSFSLESNPQPWECSWVLSQLSCRVVNLSQIYQCQQLLSERSYTLNIASQTGPNQPLCYFSLSNTRWFYLSKESLWVGKG